MKIKVILFLPIITLILYFIAGYFMYVKYNAINTVETDGENIAVVILYNPLSNNYKKSILTSRLIREVNSYDSNMVFCLCGNFLNKFKSNKDGLCALPLYQFRDKNNIPCIYKQIEDLIYKNIRKNNLKLTEVGYFTVLINNKNKISANFKEITYFGIIFEYMQNKVDLMFKL